MPKTTYSVVLALVFFLTLVPPACASQLGDGRPSVLFVLSSEGKGAGDARPGFEMDELAQAWSIFRENNIQMTFASPRGGAVEADKYDARDPANARFLADAQAVAKLQASLPLSQVDGSAFDAIYVLGGKGAMLDLARDPVLPSLIAEIYERGGVVAAICHGSAALANVRLNDGKHLVDGRRVTGFTGEEEAIFGKQWAKEFAFALEETLRARGGRWIESPLMMPGVAIDGRLVTGQNPYSTGLVADAVLQAMGIVPVSRQPRRDEASLALIARAVKGDVSAEAELAAAPGRFQPELIAIIGHYQLQAATSPEAVRQALVAMELAAPHYQADELSVSRANAMRRLGRTDQARSLVDQVLAANPGMPEAMDLQKKLQAEQ